MSSDSVVISRARFVCSPNCDERPIGTEVSLLVIHNISLPPGQYGGCWIEDLFLNQLNPKADPYFATICDLKVSSHLLIRRDGEVVQFVPFNQRAWHAGQSKFAGCGCCNDFSIGVELEGCDDQPYTAQQYQTLAQVTDEIQQLYPAITPDNIVGHSDIAPERKTDPGPAFDWPFYRRLLAGTQ
jgi:AmpD protein